MLPLLADCVVTPAGGDSGCQQKRTMAASPLAWQSCAGSALSTALNPTEDWLLATGSRVAARGTAANRCSPSLLPCAQREQNGMSQPLGSWDFVQKLGVLMFGTGCSLLHHSTPPALPSWQAGTAAPLLASQSHRLTELSKAHSCTQPGTGTLRPLY